MVSDDDGFAIEWLLKFSDQPLPADLMQGDRVCGRKSSDVILNDEEIVHALGELTLYAKSDRSTIPANELEVIKS